MMPTLLFEGNIDAQGHDHGGETTSPHDGAYGKTVNDARSTLRLQLSVTP